MLALAPTVNKYYRREVDKLRISQGIDSKRRGQTEQKATLDHKTCSKSHILGN